MLVLFRDALMQGLEKLTYVLGGQGLTYIPHKVHDNPRLGTNLQHTD